MGRDEEVFFSPSMKVRYADELLDRPETDLYDTEGTGGFPGISFFARPVIGGHFAFLALERACGGDAVAGLSFLNEDEAATGEENFEVGGGEL
jgi:hypothetical protein